jgi:methionyl-tRNA formyltransferase
MSRFRIGYLGDGPWASRALEKLARFGDEIEVAFVSPRAENQDPKLQLLASQIGCPFRIYDDINSDEALSEIRALDLDLLVSMSFNQIMGQSFLESAKHGAINCHAGALPSYRGRNVLNWAIINGETEFGVTVHFVDQGIDTGDVILQSMVSIAPEDRYADLLEKAYSECAELLIVAIRKIAAGTANRTPQPLAGGFYCGRRVTGDEWIDWNWGSEKIHNLVRGISEPGPGAWFAIGGKVHAAHRSFLLGGTSDYIGTLGEVVGRTELGVLVKAGDNVVGISDCVQVSGGGPNFRPNWRIGTRLQGRMEYRLQRLERALGLDLI